VLQKGLLPAHTTNQWIYESYAGFVECVETELSNETQEAALFSSSPVCPCSSFDFRSFVGNKRSENKHKKDFEETRSFSCLSNSPLAFTRFVGSAHHKRDSQDCRRSWKSDVSSHVSTASRMSSREQRASSFPFTLSLAAILQTASGVFVFQSAALPAFIRVLQRRLTWTSVDSFPSIITLQEQATSSPLFPQFFHLPY
jgi:hypothetical protein